MRFCAKVITGAGVVAAALVRSRAYPKSRPNGGNSRIDQSSHDQPAKSHIHNRENQRSRRQRLKARLQRLWIVQNKRPLSLLIGSTGLVVLAFVIQGKVAYIFVLASMALSGFLVR